MADKVLVAGAGKAVLPLQNFLQDLEERLYYMIKMIL